MAMVRRVAVVVAATTSAALGLSAPVVGDEPTQPVIVEVAPAADPAAVAAEHGVEPTHVYTEVLNGFSADLTRSEKAAVASDAAVKAITKDHVVARIPEPMSSARRVGHGPSSSQVPQKVGISRKRVGVDLSKTADVDYRDDRRVDTDIAIIDGGIDRRHPDLNVAGGVNCADGDRHWWKSPDLHGTMVGGFAAAIDNKIGVVGAAPGARLWSVRVVGPNPEDGIAESAILCGLQWVLKKKTIEVVNESYGASQDPPLEPCQSHHRYRKSKKHPPEAAVWFHQLNCELVRKGKTVVVAAGNDSVDVDLSDFGVTVPAAYPEVITVSAIADWDGMPGGLGSPPSDCPLEENDDHLASFSDFGAAVDIAAPGVCVSSTAPVGFWEGAAPDYANWDGTSFSTPFVSGAAALLYARYDDITPAKVRKKILKAAEPGPIPGDPDTYPEGVLNVSTF